MIPCYSFWMDVPKWCTLGNPVLTSLEAWEFLLLTKFSMQEIVDHLCWATYSIQCVKCHRCMHFHWHLDVKWVWCGCHWEDGGHLKCCSFLIFRRVGNLSTCLMMSIAFKWTTLQGGWWQQPNYSSVFGQVCCKFCSRQASGCKQEAVGWQGGVTILLLVLVKESNSGRWDYCRWRGARAIISHGVNGLDDKFVLVWQSAEEEEDMRIKNLHQELVLFSWAL